ncbi:hypothetical protein MCOR21_007004 [Pyricularia oryzae]|nr:hypothetical protein MCOR21_007004 [Pyricularia oryzae]
MPGFQKWSDMAAVESEINYQPPPPALSSPSPKILPTLEAESGDIFAPLPWGSIQGLTVVTVVACLSFLACLVLSIYITWKLISWNLRPFPPTPPSHQQYGSIPDPRSQTALEYGGANIPPEHLCPQMETSDEAPDVADEKSPRGVRLFVERLRRDPPNQFLILICNLLWADVLQCLAFMLSIHWAAQGSIDTRSRICWAQGWFLAIGDLGSSLMITAIAFHTYLGVVKNYRPTTWAFYVGLVSMWLINYLFAMVGVVLTWRSQSPLFAPVGVWIAVEYRSDKGVVQCGLNPERQDIRLYLHYLWTSLSIFVITVVYIYIYIYLQRSKDQSSTGQHYPYGPYHKMSPRPKTPSPASRESKNSSPARLSTPPIVHSPPKNMPDDEGTTTAQTTTINFKSRSSTSNSSRSNNNNNNNISTRNPAFLLYPLIFILCTAPLSFCSLAGRSSADVPQGYLCFAAVMLGAEGLLDALLYATTRRPIIFSGEQPPTQDTGIDTFAFVRTPPGRKFGNVVFVRGGEADEEAGLGGERGGGGNNNNGTSSSSSSSSGSSSGSDDASHDRRRVEVSEAKPQLAPGRMGGLFQVMSSDGREQRRKKEDNHHLRVSGMDTTRLTIQCETVMSVSVEMDPDMMNRSQASLTSEFSAIDTAYSGPSRISQS